MRFSLLVAACICALAACIVTVNAAQNGQPGTLMLNMLIKNEAEHLRRTLPLWAKLVDYWLVGVDDANTDESAEVIMEHLGHLPGEIVTVHFDGMGPTWTQVVNVGIAKYPQATFGILADADHVPLGQWDKVLLDASCSRILYTIWSQDHVSKRNLDWIYRNIPGAEVHRRTHQYLEVPKTSPNQAVYSCWSNFEIEERQGGYQDRSGKKNENYIRFLEADLRDLGEDGRSLFYLGHAHLGLFRGGNDQNPSPTDMAHLNKAIDYFTRRSRVEGFVEERFFAHYMLGEIYMQYYSDWQKAEYWFKECERIDPDHAFPVHMRGKHYLGRGEWETAYPILQRGAYLPVPQRGLYNQPIFYQCNCKHEFARLLHSPAARRALSAQLTLSEFSRHITQLETADCSHDAAVQADYRALLADLRAALADMRKAAQQASLPAAQSDRVLTVRALTELLATHAAALRDRLPPALHATWAPMVDRMREWTRRVTGEAGSGQAQQKASQNSKPAPTCRQHRRATTPFLRLVRAHALDLADAFEDDGSGDDDVEGGAVLDAITQAVQSVRSVCR